MEIKTVGRQTTESTKCKSVASSYAVQLVQNTGCSIDLDATVNPRSITTDGRRRNECVTMSLQMRIAWRTAGRA